jgi:hypothetical protein
MTMTATAAAEPTAVTKESRRPRGLGRSGHGAPDRSRSAAHAGRSRASRGGRDADAWTSPARPQR